MKKRINRMAFLEEEEEPKQTKHNYKISITVKVEDENGIIVDKTELKDYVEGENILQYDPKDFSFENLKAAGLLGKLKYGTIHNPNLMENTMNNLQPNENFENKEVTNE